MQDISEAISREFSPYISSRNAYKIPSAAFSVQELLAISQEISKEYAPRALPQPASLVLLPVDPQRLHVYWRFGRNQVLPNIKSEPPAPLTLRIFKQNDVEPSSTQNSQTGCERPESFDVLLDAGKTHQEIRLPASLSFPARLNAELGKSDAEQAFTVLLKSNITEVPKNQPDTANYVLPAAIAQFIIPSMLTSSATSKIGTTQESTQPR
ncbi:DUF4912 domain-containing protein [Methylomonas sp. AM2-LC]|uniref:DUF4912 domain-containing protein n=1 Tax=Methylomonas sp. AM2-LC TaxID=3153301 RepID=UPI0032657618